jgi:hypothetical protein
MGRRNFISTYSARQFIKLVAIAALIFGMFAGSTPASDEKSKESGNVPVRMVVTAKPHRDGAQTPAVGLNDVKVFQGDSQNKVTGWIPLQGDRAGLELFILIDDSSRASVGLQLDSIKQFIEAQPPTTAIGIGYMRNGTVFTVQNLTTDHAAAAKSLRLPIGTAADNSPYLSVTDLMKKWPVSENRREILMITSGVDALNGNPFSNPYLDAAVERAQRGGFIIYSIYSPAAGLAGRGGFRGNLAQTGMDILSQKTGGQTYYLGLGSPVDIGPYLKDISHSLRNQYELTFLTTGAKKPTLERVKVKTETPSIGLIAAEAGYVGTGI